MTSTLGPLSFVLMGCWRYGTSLYGRSAAASNSFVPLQSEELPHAIAPKGQWILTGGVTPGVGVRNPSPFSLLHTGGVQAMPIAEHLLSHFCSRPSRAQGRGGIGSPAGGHTTGYQPHAPPGRCSSLVFPRQSGHADFPLACRTLRHAVRSGHCGQRGARATQIVAPRSMIAWLNR